MKIAVVGATGLVGREMLKILEERNFSISELLLVASEKSVGKKITFKNKGYTVISNTEAVKKKPQIAIFSAGGKTSLEWAPQYAQAGATVIDNSSAWRMADNIKLVVPEVNGNMLTKSDKIIANPNCSTIQLVMVLAPLHKKFVLKRIVVSTYQSVSGSGIKGVNQLIDERKGILGEKFYPHQIDLNVLPHAGDFADNGYTSEEIKLVNESQKIIGAKFALTATVVRVPVIGGHSEAVNIEFENDFSMYEVERLLGTMPGVVLMDSPAANIYPMPIIAHGRDEVFVGRLRRDFSQPNSLNLWVVSDNLRKGAATNAVQIAEFIVKNNLV
jgi:aspartate-semialdehyde dehydrogenase